MQTIELYDRLTTFPNHWSFASQNEWIDDITATIHEFGEEDLLWTLAVKTKGGFGKPGNDYSYADVKTLVLTTRQWIWDHL